MAIKLDFPILTDLSIPNAYCMIGDIRFHVVDQTAEIDVWVYKSEAARRQDESVPHAERRPLKVHTIHAPHATYTAFLEGDVKALVSSAYKLLATMPEPHGLQAMIESGEAV